MVYLVYPVGIPVAVEVPPEPEQEWVNERDDCEDRAHRQLNLILPGQRV